VIIKPATRDEREAIIVLLQTYFFDTDNLEMDNFLIALNEGSERILGCAELTLKPLCELKRIAVHPNYKNKGIGTQLVTRTLERVTDDVYLRTTTPVFFEKMSFRKLPDSAKKELWDDCAICDKFERCTQTAMVHHRN